MKITLARSAGFCMGVRRAMEIAVNASRSSRGDVYAYGPLIHNAQATQLLESRGVKVLGDKTLAPECSIVIRAHGIPPFERSELDKSGATVIDATCPHVVASQRRIEKYSSEGSDVVLVGDRDHPEMRGLAGYAQTTVYQISTLAEANALDLTNKFIVIGQTTFDESLYRQIGEVLSNKYTECTVFDSICNATEIRQREVAQIAAKSDALVVVGGKNSANTLRLAEIGRQTGKPVFLIETAEELRAEDFSHFDSVGLTAGASTPGWVTVDVIDKLESFSRKGFIGSTISLFKGLVRSRLVTAIGGAALGHAVFTLIGGHENRWDALLLAATFLFVAYVINRPSPKHRATRKVVDVDPFFQKYRRPLIAGAVCAFASSLLLAWHIGYEALLLVSVASLAAVLYAVPLLPKSFRYRRLRDIPASKDLFVALAWACVITGAVAISSDYSLSSRKLFAAGTLIFLFTLSMTTMLDLRDCEGDHLVGVETLPVLVGRKLAIALAYAVQWLVLCITLALAFIYPETIDRGFALLFITVPLYGMCALYLLVRNHFRDEAKCQLIVDGQLLLAGILSILWSNL